MNNNIKINSTVAFIANPIWVVPATIIRIYDDGKLDLEISEIIREEDIEIIGEGLSIEFKPIENTLIKKSIRLNVMECNPRSIITREEFSLSRTMSGNGMSQSSSDKWVETGKSRLPKLTGIQTALIGKWFDPSQWNYKLYCFMDAFKHRILRRDYPALEINLPLNDEVYLDFQSAFDSWFAEVFESRYLKVNKIPSMWSRVEIKAIEKPIIKEIENDIKRNSPRTSTSSSISRNSKSRKVRSKETLQRTRKQNAR